MRLKLPRLFAVDFPIGPKDRVQQLESDSVEVEGDLAAYETPGLKGWFFQSPTTEQILIVPYRTRVAPVRFDRVVAFDLTERGEYVDASAGRWLATPVQTLRATEEGLDGCISEIVASWSGAFTYAQEDRTQGLPGLRAPQIGALHALKAFWTVDSSTATIVMPTGTGKTETMLSILVSGACQKVLVVVPTDALRSQLLEKFVTLGLLKDRRVGVVSADAKFPLVCSLSTIPQTAAAVDLLMSRTQVCVTTSAILGRCSADVQKCFAAHCRYLFIDEAHHVEAPTWSAFKSHFSESRIVQFTATPYREDGKQLEGKIIFEYPLRKAQEEDYFRPIQFLALNIYDRNLADHAIAEAAIARLREEWDLGHVLMARVSSRARAADIFPMYAVHEDLGAVEMHTGMSQKDLAESRSRLLSGAARVVVCVDMLGEGFDMPELKIAAFHDIRKSLAITLQIAGRFTRSRPDLGNATFIANVADIDVRKELRKLYRQDPDWNVLLPELSEYLIGEEATSQQFIADFGDFPSEIPLQAVRPATSTVIYRTTCEEWDPYSFRAGIPAIDDCVQIRHAVNEEANVLVVVTTRRVSVPWTDAQNLNSYEWELYVAYWNPEANLLFINSSGNKGEFGPLAHAVTGGRARLISGEPLFRAFAGLVLVRFQNVGLREHLGRNVRYTGRMGGDVEPSITLLQRGNATKALLAGTGYQRGQLETIGVSIKGRIWSHRRERLQRFPRWCDEIGQKVLDRNIDPDEIFKHCLLAKPIPTRPDKMTLAIDWPSLVYEALEKNWVVVIDENEFAIGNVAIELVDRSIGRPLRFQIATEESSVEIELIFTVEGEEYDFNFQVRGERHIKMKHGLNGREQSLPEFFHRDPPKIWFVDGSSLEGNSYTEMRSPQPAYSAASLEAWDWTGIDITVESQRRDKRANSIQWKVIDRLKREQTHTVVFDDDNSGEAADVISLKVIGGMGNATAIEVDFYHCKFSGDRTPGARIDDLYELCGQAQKSMWWGAIATKRADLFSHMLKREEQWINGYGISRFELGDANTVRTIQRMAEILPVSLSITIVQPGVSKERVSEPQLVLLGVTQTFIKNHSELPFRVICSN